MKKLLFIVLAVFTIHQTNFGQKPKNEHSKTEVKIEVRRDDRPNNDVPRLPFYVNIEAFYDCESKTISICYNGEAEGEVYLYLNGNVVDYSDEINTSFDVQDSGLYEIEIVTDSWTGYGSFEI